MVDVSSKPESARSAVARGCVRMQPETVALIREHAMKKGDVFQVARLAAITAVKRTSDLIPLCHPLALTMVSLELLPDRAANAVYCAATVETRGQTGVEMEALTAVQIALLTIYDMCKAVDRGMTMQGIRLVEKSGGQSGEWRRGE